MAKLIKKVKKTGLTGKTFIEGIRVIGRCLRPHKKTLIVLSILSVVDAVAQGFIPLLTGKIFDTIISIAQNPLITSVFVFALIGAWLILQVSDNAASWRIATMDNKLSTIVEAEYIVSGLGKLFEMPLSFHTNRKHGDIADRINRAAGWLSNIVSNVLLNLIPNFLSIMLALMITLFINWRLTVVLIAAIVIYSIVLWRSVKPLFALQIKMNLAYNRAYGNTWDALESVKEIKQAATEKHEQRKIRRSFIDRAATFWLRLNAIIQGLNFSQKILITLTQLSIFILSVFFVKNGTLTPGGLVAFNAYAAMILGPFVILGQNWQTIQNGLVSIVRAENVLSVAPESYKPKNAVAPKKLKGEVVFNDVHFSYKGGNEILNGVSFSVKPGEKIALVGESGMGKTTITDLLCGFYFPQKGNITVDDINVKMMDLKAYRSRIGVVPQEPTLFNDTIANNIRYGNFRASEESVKEAAREAHANDFIESFKKQYKQMVGWRGVKLSVGQKQRISIARAFLRKPDILILDEPTSALDAKSEHFIKESFDKLMEGRTTFIIAHRLSTVREADMILVLKKGKIAERGKHEELINIPNGIYRNLYNLQTGFAK